MSIRYSIEEYSHKIEQSQGHSSDLFYEHEHILTQNVLSTTNRCQTHFDACLTFSEEVKQICRRQICFTSSENLTYIILCYMIVISITYVIYVTFVTSITSVTSVVGCCLNIDMCCYFSVLVLKIIHQKHELIFF